MSTGATSACFGSAVHARGLGDMISKGTGLPTGSLSQTGNLSNFPNGFRPPEGEDIVTHWKGQTHEKSQKGEGDAFGVSSAHQNQIEIKRKSDKTRNQIRRENKTLSKTLIRGKCKDRN